MSSASIYLRVSTQKQAESENGLEAQRLECLDWCESAGINVAGVFIDAGVSGGAELSERPALMEALDNLRKGDVLVVAKRDRIARDVLNNAVIEKMISDRKAEMVSADGTGNGNDPASLLMRNILSAMAQYEKALAGMRTRAAMKAMKKAGRVYGKIPFGFRRDGDRFVPDLREGQILNDVKQWRSTKTTWATCAARLNGSERYNRAGSQWSTSNLYKVFRRSQAA